MGLRYQGKLGPWPPRGCSVPEVRDASGSNSVGACDRRLRGGFWRDLFAKISDSGPATLPAQATSADGQARAVTNADAPATNVSGAGARAPKVIAPAPTPPAYPPVEAVSSCAGNPNALGICRVVEIDTTGGPGFGLEHFKSHDFLREGEVVLTFDDGPWPKNTPAVLAALAAHCTKAIFFPIGLHATYEPGILKQVAAAGHAIGSHTWCHQDLSKTKGRCNVNGKVETVEYDPKDEIEKGISAVIGRSAAQPHPISASRHCDNRRNLWTISASETLESSQPTWILSTLRCASPSR
jgi:Polysaccharide deacetylase